MSLETLRNAAKASLAIQDACNLSGVVREWAKHMPAIIEDCNSTANIGRHPVSVMFLSKIASLASLDLSSIGGVSNMEGNDVFTHAYATCERWAKEKP